MLLHPPILQVKPVGVKETDKGDLMPITRIDQLFRRLKKLIHLQNICCGLFFVFNFDTFTTLQTSFAVVELNGQFLHLLTNIATLWISV